MSVAQTVHCNTKVEEFWTKQALLTNDFSSLIKGRWGCEIMFCCCCCCFPKVFLSIAWRSASLLYLVGIQVWASREQICQIRCDTMFNQVFEARRRCFNLPVWAQCSMQKNRRWNCDLKLSYVINWLIYMLCLVWVAMNCYRCTKPPNPVVPCMKPKEVLSIWIYTKAF